VSKTWEWREGRLLAYELVFQFLIKNHWLYTFGASGAMRTHADEHKRCCPVPVTCNMWWVIT